MIEMPSIDEYPNEVPDRSKQNKYIFADNIFLYIKWVGGTFLKSLNLFVEKLNLLSGEIDEISEGIKQNKADILSAKSMVTSTLGATYSGLWNAEDDFTNKTVSYNGMIWVGLSPTVGIEPSLSSSWLFVTNIRREVTIESDYVAKIGDKILVDSSSGVVNITCPQPIENGRFSVVDLELMFKENKVALYFPNATFYKRGEVIDLKDDGSSFTFVCIKLKNNTYDWRVE